MRDYTLVDRIRIMAEMRENPADVADEVARLRAMRDRAIFIHDYVGTGGTAFGMGVRAGARCVLGCIRSPEHWLRAIAGLNKFNDN